MRKWYLVPLVMLCLVLQSSLLACTDDGASGPTEAEETEQTVVTTTVRQTTTTLPLATWELLAPEGESPEGRLGSSVYCDDEGGRLLLFGGWVERTTYTNVIWSYDLASGAWTDIRPETALPAGRASHAWAHDPSGNSLIVFGGYDGTAYYGDTWAYDLRAGTWADLQPSGATPRAREGHSLTYDPVSEKMILFGGYDGGREYDDTWSYDPATNTWTELSPSGDIPAARDSHRVVYDPDEEIMVLFAGWSTTTQFADTWAYDPADNAWTPLSPAGDVPVARALHAMAYDPTIKKVVLFGGGTSSAVFADTWTYDYPSNTWTETRLTGGAPTGRAGHVLAFDEGAGRVILYGGSDGAGGFLDDTWGLNR